MSRTSIDIDRASQTVINKASQTDINKASQTELPALVDVQVPEQDVQKILNDNEMTSQRVQYYQCPCCKCGNTHYQQLVSGSIPGCGCTANVVYEVPQRLSTTAETGSPPRQSYNQNNNEYRRQSNSTPYGERQRKRNGLNENEDEDDPDCICPRNNFPSRPPPPSPQQQQKKKCCCPCCGSPVKPYKDNSTATGQDPNTKCLPTCKPKKRMIDEEVMVVPTYDSKEVTVAASQQSNNFRTICERCCERTGGRRDQTKEVSANTAKMKPRRGSVPASQQSNNFEENCQRCCERAGGRRDDKEVSATTTKMKPCRCTVAVSQQSNDFRENCERCCERRNGRQDDRYDEGRAMRPSRPIEQNGYESGSENQYKEPEEVCCCCGPINPICRTCRDFLAEHERGNRKSTVSMISQDCHLRSNNCHMDPVCSICQIEQFSDKSKPILVDEGVNTMPVKKRCSLFDRKSKK